MPNLLLCMTPGVGLHTWERLGTLQRELRPYKEYVRKGWNVKILTFDKEDPPVLPKGMEAIRFPDRKLLWLLPWIHKKTGVWADLIKTNQSVHSYFYTFAASCWKKPILLRCGYVHGEFLESTKGSNLKVKLYQFMEKKAFCSSNHCEVPTEELSIWIKEKYNVSLDKVSIVPNFVDIEIFRPIAEIKKKETSVVSVGRLLAVKNFQLLIMACAEIPGCTLTIIGEGPEREQLQQLAKDCDTILHLPGNIPNHLLPHMIQEHTLFATSSSWEGHPKALIEAMACGMPCVAVEAAGIKNIVNESNGLLVHPSLLSLTEGLKVLLYDSGLRNKLSSGARKFAETRFSFNECFSREYSIVQRLISE